MTRVTRCVDADSYRSGWPWGSSWRRSSPPVLPTRTTASGPSSSNWTKHRASFVSRPRHSTTRPGRSATLEARLPAAEQALAEAEQALTVAQERLAQARGELAAAKAQDAAAAAKLAAAEQRVRDQEARIVEITARIDGKRAAMSQLAVEAYQQGAMGRMLDLAAVFEAEDVDDFTARVTYAQSVLNAEDTVLTGMEDDRVDLANERVKLEELREEARRLREEAARHLQRTKELEAAAAAARAAAEATRSRRGRPRRLWTSSWPSDPAPSRRRSRRRPTTRSSMRR